MFSFYDLLERIYVWDDDDDDNDNNDNNNNLFIYIFILLFERNLKRISLHMQFPFI